jgi:hypothetical protein
MKEMGRLALREEGKQWNAYYALPDTMEGAIFLGSIAMRFVIDNPKRKQAFMKLMQDSIGDVIKELMGQRVYWPEPQPAPDHERTKET